MMRAAMIKFTSPKGATPLSPDEVKNLIPGHLSQQKELDAWEADNISLAQQWAFQRIPRALLTEPYIKKLHEKMFDKTWLWAGEFRRHETNIGCYWGDIAMNLSSLLREVQYRLDHTVYPFDEICSRFHHELVSIHPFVNGNGRHARLMTDVLRDQHKKRRFSWGATQGVTDITQAGEIRTRYIKALQEADQHNIDPLMDFVRS